MDIPEKDPLWESFIANNSVVVDDQGYAFDREQYDDMLNKSPWQKQDNYFKKCKISLLALVRILQHAKKGGQIEVMGYFRGKIIHDTYVVTDAYPLPVEGTETRVNAGREAEEYAGQFTELCEVMRKNEEVLGWYHSHPNYGPWLSGIDVNTQKNMQMIGPMVAIVIDPIRTEISGRVDIGAFRTCTKPREDDNALGEAIPEDKIKDFGIHYKSYYKLETEFFLSSSDLQIIEYTWSRLWKAVLAALQNTQEFITNDPVVWNLANNKLIDNEEDFRKTLADQIAKGKKARGFGLGGQSNFLVGKTEQEGDSKQRLKDLTKFAMELSQAVHQECAKCLAFSG